MKLLFTLIAFLTTTLLSAQWTQQGTNLPTPSAPWLTNTVSMPDVFTVATGDIGWAGRKGIVRVYRWQGNSWFQKGLAIEGEAFGDNSGWSVSMPDSNTIGIGAPWNDGNGRSAGHVRVYSWNASNWVQRGQDIEGDSLELSGYAISMPDSNTIAISSPNYNGKTGRVRVYSWTGVNWLQRGAPIDGEALNDESGLSISMPDQITLAIGAPFNDGNGSNSGHTRVYQWNGISWNQIGIDVDGAAAFDQSGFSVNMPDPSTLAIGAPGNDANGPDRGHVRVYTWSGLAWIQKGQDLNGAGPTGLRSGYSVSMPNPDFVAVGAPWYFSLTGFVTIYKWSSPRWSRFGNQLVGDTLGHSFGSKLSMPDTNLLAVASQGKGRVYRYQLLTQLSENRSYENISFFPNPSNGELNIELEEYSNIPLQILDLSGKQILEFQLNESRNHLDLTGLSEGIYFVRYGEVTKKLVITR